MDEMKALKIHSLLNTFNIKHLDTKNRMVPEHSVGEGQDYYGRFGIEEGCNEVKGLMVEEERHQTLIGTITGHIKGGN
jgi:hypothetical protein